MCTLTAVAEPGGRDVRRSDESGQADSEDND